MELGMELGGVEEARATILRLGARNLARHRKESKSWSKRFRTVPVWNASLTVSWMQPVGAICLRRRDGIASLFSAALRSSHEA